MNSALQCLLSSSMLVAFFMFDQYKHDVNPSSPTKGHLANGKLLISGVMVAFAGFVKEVYGTAGQRSVTPTALKRQFENYAPDHFVGNEYAHRS